MWPLTGSTSSPWWMGASALSRPVGHPRDALNMDAGSLLTWRDVEGGHLWRVTQIVPRLATGRVFGGDSNHNRVLVWDTVSSRRRMGAVAWPGISKRRSGVGRFDHLSRDSKQERI